MLGSIGQKARNFSRWVGSQVVESDFGPGDQRARDYAVLGAAAGAVTGATIGAVKGFDSQASNSIDEVWVERDIKHPSMNGYRHYTTPDYRTTCKTDYNGDETCTTEIEGWWHHYSPNINNRIVGNFQEPTFRNSNFLEPLMGGILGAVAGGALGIAAGLGANALQRTLEEKSGKAPAQPVRLEPKAQEKLTERTGTAAIVGTVAGAGLGAFIGAKAGSIELGAQEVHTRSWQIPVTQTETLGHVPSSHYEWNWSGFPLPLGGNRAATEPVNRQVPVYDRSGSPTMTFTEETFKTNRYGPVFGGLAGGVIGAGVGLAAGVAFGLTDKLLTEKSALDQAKKEKADQTKDLSRNVA